MKKLFLLIVISIYLNSAEYYNMKSTEYYLDDKRVLLYKILNHWNLADSYDYEEPCGRDIKAKLNSGIDLHYDKKKQKVTIDFDNSFAKLLSVVKECDDCKGYDGFKNVWFNSSYFQDINSTIKINKKQEIGAIIIYGISPSEFDRLDAEKDKLELRLEGKVFGLFLRSNKIALHRFGVFLRECGNIKDFPFVIEIINKANKEILIKYNAILTR